MLRPFARGFTLANVKCKISRQGTPEPASTLILPIRSRRILTASSPFSMCQIETGWDYSRKKLLPRAFFARLHVTYSPSRQSRATAIRLKRITLRLLTNSSFSLLGPCAVCSLPLGQCLTKSLKTHRSWWIIRPSDGGTLVSQTRHWLDLAGPKVSVITQSNSSAFSLIRKLNVRFCFNRIFFVSSISFNGWTASNSFVRRSSNKLENRTFDVISRDRYISVPLFNNYEEEPSYVVKGAWIFNFKLLVNKKSKSYCICTILYPTIRGFFLVCF